MILPSPDEKAFVTTKLSPLMMARVDTDTGKIIGAIDSGTGIKNTPTSMVAQLGLAGVAECTG